MDKISAQSIIAFELEACCPDTVDVKRCAGGIADSLNYETEPRFHQVRNVVRDGLQDLDAHLVEDEMEQLASEIAELLCIDSDDAEEEGDFHGIGNAEDEED